MLPLYATMNSGVHWLGLRFRFPGGRWITSAFLSMMKTSSALIRSFCTPEGAINILSGLSRIVSEPPDPGNKVMGVVSFKFCSPLMQKLQKNFSTNLTTDYGRPVRKSPSLHGRKSIPPLKSLGSPEPYFVCYIGPNFHISLIYAFIGCP